MAIDLTYKTEEKQDKEWQKVNRHFNTEMDAVKQIIPQEEKVAVHLEGETIMIPFRRVLELRVDLDPETVKQVEQANKEE
jgi:hypothetical protein